MAYQVQADPQIILSRPTQIQPAPHHVANMAWATGVERGVAGSDEDPYPTSGLAIPQLRIYRTPLAEEEIPVVDNLTGLMVPLVWAELTLADGTHVFAKVDLADPGSYFGGFKEGRLLGVGAIKRALSDRMGNYESATFNCTFTDTDHLLRGKLASQATKWWLNRFVTLRMVSDAGRRLLRVPRIIGIGYLRDYAPISPLQFSIQCEDYLALFVGLGANEKQIPKRTIPLADFPGCPAEKLNLPVPVIYGEVSDRNQTTIIEYPGFALQKPQNITAQVIGGTPGVTKKYAITAMNDAYGPCYSRAWSDHRGETDAAWITVNNAPTDDDIREDPANHHVIITVDAQPGQTGGRAYGRYPDYVRGLDGLDSPGAWGVVPAGKYQYWDGWRPYGRADWNSTKSDGVPPTTNNTLMDPVQGIIDTGTGLVPTIYVGERVLPDGNTWREFLVCGHAVKAILGWYVGGVRIPDSTEGTDWLVPGFAGWTALLGAAKYRDYNGRRYTVLFGKGPNANEAATDSTKALTLNVQGVEDKGDGSGVLLEDGFDQYLHVMRNWILQDYQGGGWFATGPSWPGAFGVTAVQVLDDAAFTAAKAVAQARFAGGYKGAFIMGAGGKQDTVRAWIQRLNVGLDAFSGFSRKMQYMVRLIDTDPAILATAQRYQQTTDIYTGTFQVKDRVADFENVVVFARQRDYQNSTWKIPAGELSDQDSITNTQQAKRSQTLELWVPPTEAQAQEVVGRRLTRTKEPPRFVSFVTGLQALNTELGAIIRVSHLEGIGGGGWVDRPIFVTRHELDPDRLAITIEGIDVDRLFTGGFILGDEATMAPLWTNASATERGYGYLCDETTGLFSDSQPGKRLR